MVREKILGKTYKKLPFLWPWQPIKFSNLNRSNLEQINISVKKNPNIPIETDKIVNFHFSHYSSMENISCHSNQSSNPTQIKTQFIYVEAYVIHMYAKYQLHPPYGFWKKIFKCCFFSILHPFYLPGNQ